MTRSSFRRSNSKLIVLALLLVACGKDSNPTEPITSGGSSALFGTWIGTLTGPDATQRSGWESGSLDSVWIAFNADANHTGGRMDFLIAPTGSGPYLSDHLPHPAGSCPFDRYASALNYFSDPSVSFRVNLSHQLSFATAVFQGTRNGNTLSGNFVLPGDTLAGHLTAALCTTCPNSSVTTSIEPSNVGVGSIGFALVVNGANFTPCSVVRLDDVDRATTFRSETQLTASISTADLRSAGVRTIIVFTPIAGGGRSNGQTLRIGPLP